MILNIIFKVNIFFFFFLKKKKKKTRITTRRTIAIIKENSKIKVTVVLRKIVVRTSIKRTIAVRKPQLLLLMQ